ncbi:MAG: RHS repeat domain-containing protein [Bacillota bacterium]
MAGVTEDYTDRTDYAYDAAGRLISAVRPNGEFYRYTYDASGNLISEARGEYAKDGTFKVSETTGQLVTSTRTGEKGPIVSTYEYDANGRLVYTVAPRGDEEAQEEEGKPEGTDEATGENTALSTNGKGAGKGSSATSADV